MARRRVDFVKVSRRSWAVLRPADLLEFTALCERARTDASTMGNLDMIDLDEFHTRQSSLLN